MLDVKNRVVGLNRSNRAIMMLNNVGDTVLYKGYWCATRNKYPLLGSQCGDAIHKTYKTDKECSKVDEPGYTHT